MKGESVRLTFFDPNRSGWIAHTVAMALALLIFGSVGFGVVWLMLQFVSALPAVNPG